MVTGAACGLPYGLVADAAVAVADLCRMHCACWPAVESLDPAGTQVAARLTDDSHDGRAGAPAEVAFPGDGVAHQAGARVRLAIRVGGQVVELAASHSDTRRT